MKKYNPLKQIAFSLLLLITLAGASFGQTTTFTYQGKLNDGTVAANGSYQFEFKLFDSQTVGTGTQIGGTLTNVPATVTNGIFTVQLDFGANAFDGADRFLEISVRRNSGETFVALAPRQPLTSAPYAIKSRTAETAATANNTTQLGGVNANQYVQTTDSRLTDSRDPKPGSGNYIQNTTTQQSTSNFNISGEGKADVLSAATQINVAGRRALISPNSSSIFAGNLSGNFSVSGSHNSFFGVSSGSAIANGSSNSFFGHSAGASNSGGSSNTFIGAGAGLSNVAGNNNTFVGNSSGVSNKSGFNSFFGSSAGGANENGSSNVFLGANAGSSNQNGSGNTFVGNAAGTYNTSGNNNTILGKDANVALDLDLSYATALGAGAIVSASNTIVLGRANGMDKVQIFGLGSAGSTTLCRNASNQISTCSSSLRYKTNINSFNYGLNIINRLKPITFDWKDGGMKDLGLGAEDVAEVDENLIIRNERGEVEGVKYDRIGVILINAVKEQQAQIEAQARQIEQLKKLVCSQNKDATVCR